MLGGDGQFLRYIVGTARVRRQDDQKGVVALRRAPVPTRVSLKKSAAAKVVADKGVDDTSSNFLRPTLVDANAPDNRTDIEN